MGAQVSVPTISMAETGLGRTRRLDIRRIYPALVFIPLFIALLRYGPPIAFFGLVTLSALCALAELYLLYFNKRGWPLEANVGLFFLALLLFSVQWPSVLAVPTVCVLAIVSMLTVRMFMGRDLAGGLADSAVLTFSLLYIGLTLGTLLQIRGLLEGDLLILFLFLVTWGSDAGAYYAGTLLGRHKLAPTISPNKTIEGLIGGLLVAITLALLARSWFLPSFTLADTAACGVLLTFAGLLGDLTESMIKRSVGAKDSGSLIMGHGGMFDRLDSLLFAAPAFYFYATMIKGITP